jgi:hypothetical protein
VHLSEYALRRTVRRLCGIAELPRHCSGETEQKISDLLIGYFRERFRDPKCLGVNVFDA